MSVTTILVMCGGIAVIAGAVVSFIVGRRSGEGAHLRQARKLAKDASKREKGRAESEARESLEAADDEIDRATHDNDLGDYLTGRRAGD